MNKFKGWGGNKFESLVSWISLFTIYIYIWIIIDFIKKNKRNEGKYNPGETLRLYSGISSITLDLKAPPKSTAHLAILSAKTFWDLGTWVREIFKEAHKTRISRIQLAISKNH